MNVRLKSRLLGGMCALPFALGTATAANAAVTTTDCGGGTSCTMTQLYGGGTITAGSLRFHSFSFVFNNGSTVNEDVITLTGLDDGGVDPGPGFRLDSNSELSTAAGEFIGYAFSFSVTDINGASTMKDGSLLAGSNSVGADDVWETEVYVPSRMPDGTWELEIRDATSSPAVLFDDSLAFAPSSAITSLHNITLAPLSPGSTGASLDSYTFRVSVVPVPAAVWLLGSGLVAFGAIARRRKQTT